MKKLHGIADAKKRAALGGDEIAVIITDEGKFIALNIANQAFGADLTPEQARWIATQLTAAAERCEANK